MIGPECVPAPDSDDGQTPENGPLLVSVIRGLLEGSGLELRESRGSLIVTNPALPENGSFTVDHEWEFLGWEHLEYTYWNFDDFTGTDPAELIAARIKETLTKL